MLAKTNNYNNNNENTLIIALYGKIGPLERKPSVLRTKTD